MRLIDVLNMISEGELEEDTIIRHNGEIYVYRDGLLLNTQNKNSFVIYGKGALNGEVLVTKAVNNNEIS